MCLSNENWKKQQVVFLAFFAFFAFLLSFWRTDNVVSYRKNLVQLFKSQNLNIVF